MLRVITFLLVAMSLVPRVGLAKEKTQRDLMRKLVKVRPGPLASIFTDEYSALAATGLVLWDKLEHKDYLALGYRKVELKGVDGSVTAMYVKIPKTPRPFFLVVGGLGNTLEMAAFRKYAFPVDKYYGWGTGVSENSSSPHWANRNGRMMLSGYEAGWDLYLKLKALRENPEFGCKISELHVMGLSLGGNDLAYASYFDSILNTNIIDGSALAWNSPTYRLGGVKLIRKKTGIIGLFIERVLSGIYSGSKNLLESISSVTLDGFSRDASMNDLISKLYIRFSRRYFKNNPDHFRKNKSGIRMVPEGIKGDKITLKSFKQMMELKDFLPKIKTPLLWVGNHDDPVVDYKYHAKYLNQYDLPGNIAIADYTLGGHLGNPIINGRKWQMKSLMSYMVYWGKKDYNYYMQWITPKCFGSITHFNYCDLPAYTKSRPVLIKGDELNSEGLPR